MTTDPSPGDRSKATHSSNSLPGHPSAGLICRRPILPHARSGALGLSQALEAPGATICHRSQQGFFWTRTKSSSCKCKSLVRARRPGRRLDFVALPVRFQAPRTGNIGHLGEYGGGRASRSRSPARGSSTIVTTARSASSRAAPRSVELICRSGSNENFPGSSTTIQESGGDRPRSSSGSQGLVDSLKNTSGLLVLAKEEERNISNPVVKLKIGETSRYIRLLATPSAREDQQRSAPEAGDPPVTFPSHRSDPPWDLSLPHVAVATIASVLFGYHIGVVNVPLQYIAQDLGFGGSAIAQGLLVSLLLGGAFVGCAASGLIADGVGRRRAFQLSSVPMIAGAILCASSMSLKMMLYGRFLVGVGLGLSGPLASLYVSEISPTAVRGAYGSLLQVAGCCGILGALVAGFPSSSIIGWWRVCFWISTGPAVLLAVAMQFCAESPRWLFKRKQYGKAEMSLERLWGPLHVKEAMSDLLVKEQLEAGRRRSWCDLLDRQYSRVVLIGAALFAFQQLAGINAVFYFSSTVFRQAGITSDVYASICVGIANLFASLLATYLMDRQGRRPLLILSFSGMGVAMAIQASAAAFPLLAPIQGSLAVFSTLTYVMMFALGAGPVPGLLLPELFADGIRAKAMSIAMCIHWIVNFVVGLTFLQLLHKYGAAALYAFFAMVCVVAAVFVSQMIFETRGKTLDEIQALLLTSEPPT
ncbi:probable plastidic glucose transporter 2 [Selaginella moellendorffii]|nr:probable plastidic glucose transporter 2 [Selaginella moellendorffii]|eukprot:XP_002974043.2 probable plastidic glucose transporter 2 [Selaginella moellendorffii]